ncbi:hypothetical protein [Bacillus suaedaesalsae]|uniref:Uncharacterized protein n=1 Tax=Bacillus suaedaesalsae TaxID=2810349 RepID=A0ABS2DE11_9BACI|nr:hypothetical protein [Bacillus suaedaesalsae]MBM6616692.1 hypothetical protein [Bacillus suaedaesalsae]
MKKSFNQTASKVGIKKVLLVFFIAIVLVLGLSTTGTYGLLKWMEKNDKRYLNSEEVEQELVEKKMENGDLHDINTIDNAPIEEKSAIIENPKYNSPKQLIDEYHQIFQTSDQQEASNSLQELVTYIYHFQELNTIEKSVNIEFSKLKQYAIMVDYNNVKQLIGEINLKYQQGQ